MAQRISVVKVESHHSLMTHSYLLEIGLEEVPAQLLLPACTQLEAAVKAFCQAHQLPEPGLQVFSTPRRLAVLASGLPERQTDRTLEVKGPPVEHAQDAQGQWTKAAEGFARKNAVTAADLEVREISGKAYVFAVRQESGRPVPELLTEAVPGWISGLSFPKNMRWGPYRMRFIRPIRWIVSLWDEQVIPVSLEMVQADRKSRGHRFLGDREVSLSQATGYEEVLKEQFVEADAEQRRASIVTQIRGLEQQHGFHVKLEEDLLQEVTNLVEWPTALVGSFEEEFLEVPAPVLVTSMATHQRYFPVFDPSGEKLQPYFVTVRNGDSRSLDTVRLGNEKVLRARLSDARFFYQEDRKRDFAYFGQKAEQVVFFQKRGSQGQRIERLRRLSRKIAAEMALDQSRQEQADRIAELCKFDLFTQMVYEFPELQGMMGEDYARLKAEPELICRGIREHYSPRNAEDSLPGDLETVAVALADRLDQLAVAFSLGMIPTGSADPYALRRAAQGVVQVILGWPLNLNFSWLVQQALQELDAQQKLELDVNGLQGELLKFLDQRVRWYFQERGIRHDVAESVLGGAQSPLGQLQLAQALEPHLDRSSFKKAVEAVVRCINISAKTPLPESASLVPEALEHAAEQMLWSTVQALQEGTNPEVFLGDLFRMAPPITEFFEAVLVMDPDPVKQQNRLFLCSQVARWSTAQLDLRALVLSGS